MKADITKTELKSRLAYLGYSLASNGSEVEAYPKGKRGDASIFEDGEFKNWNLYITAKADASQRFAAKLELACAKVPLADEFKRALVAWFETEGAAWMDTLRTAWYNGNYGRHEASGTLQQLRNTVGHEFLHAFSKL